MKLIFVTLLTLFGSLAASAAEVAPSQATMEQKLSALGSRSFRCEVKGFLKNSDEKLVKMFGKISEVFDYVYVLAMDENAAIIQALNKLEVGRTPKRDLVTVNFKHNKDDLVYVTDTTCKEL